MIMLPAEAPHSDHVAFAGRWQMLKAVLAGEEMPEFAARKIELYITGNGYAVSFDGEVTDRGTFVLEPHALPKILTLHGVEGTNAGRLIPCIYQLVGDRLRISYGLDGVRPVEFVYAKDRLSYVATYQRKSP